MNFRKEWTLVVNCAGAYAMAIVVVVMLMLFALSFAGCGTRELQPEDRQYELSAIPCDSDNCGKRP